MLPPEDHCIVRYSKEQSGDRHVVVGMVGEAKGVAFCSYMDTFSIHYPLSCSKKGYPRLPCAGAQRLGSSQP